MIILIISSHHFLFAQSLLYQQHFIIFSCFFPRLCRKKLLHLFLFFFLFTPARAWIHPKCQTHTLNFSRNFHTHLRIINFFSFLSSSSCCCCYNIEIHHHMCKVLNEHRMKRCWYFGVIELHAYEKCVWAFSLPFHCCRWKIHHVWLLLQILSFITNYLLVTYRMFL